MASPDGIKKPTLDQLLHAFAKHEAENPPALTAGDHAHIAKILALAADITPKQPVLVHKAPPMPTSKSEYSLAADTGTRTAKHTSTSVNGLEVLLTNDAKTMVLYIRSKQEEWVGRILNFDFLDEHNAPIFSGYATLSPNADIFGFYTFEAHLSDSERNAITHGIAVHAVAVTAVEWNARVQAELQQLAQDETCSPFNIIAEHILAENEVR